MNHIMNFRNIERRMMKLSVLRKVFLVLFLFGSLGFSLLLVRWKQATTDISMAIGIWSV